MNVCKLSSLFAKLARPSYVPVAGLKRFGPPVDYSQVEFTERAKLPFVPKVPQYPPALKVPKMQKRLRLMRGPELVHNTLLHKQYAIVATGGGRLRYGHFEMIRMTLGRKMDTDRMFAIWRVDPPWQPLTKKGQGQRMGKGKGSIDHYVTPVKEGRVIIEVGGRCEFKEVKRVLSDLAAKMPFKAEAVSQEILDARRLKEEQREQANTNIWPMKYVIQNNFGGCHRWMSPTDFKHFGKYK